MDSQAPRCYGALLATTSQIDGHARAPGAATARL